MKPIIDQHTFGPWALITGASSGIGKEFARQLAACKLNLVLVARRFPLLESLGKELAQQYGIQYRTLEVDLSEENAIKKITDATRDLDIGLLISNAGTGRPGNFLSFQEEELRYVFQLNAISHLQLTHYFGKLLAKRGKGGILFTGAMGSANGVPYMANEAGTKGYITSLGKSLHTEFKALGIHLTVLITSPTDTPVLGQLGFTHQNMPMKPLPVAQCVRESLLALRANRSTVLPGRKYRMMNVLVPGSLSRKIMGKTMKRNNNLS